MRFLALPTDFPLLTKYFLTNLTWYLELSINFSSSAIAPIFLAMAQEKDDAQYEEQLHLHGSDHPGMQLVTFPLTDSNYRMWRNAVVTTLESKDKLGIVDGSCMMPKADSKYYRRWRKVNSMVVSWLKASISKEIVQQFPYINNAADLWAEIEERYGV